MINFILKVAGCVVETAVAFVSTQLSCSKFTCSEVPDFCVKTTAADISFEREKSAREDAAEGRPVREYGDAYLEILALQRKITEELFAYDTLLFHGSVVAVDGEGYLFTAKSGTGKSTHTRLWREAFGERAVMVNDDKPFLKMTENGVQAYGSPWMGKHRLGANINVPLKAICILERGEKNVIRQISPKEALPMLIQQSNRPMDPEKMSKYLELIDQLAKGVGFFRLQCNMDPEAAHVAYEAMCK